MLRFCRNSLLPLIALAPLVVPAAEPSTPQGTLRAEAPARLAKPATSVYLVQLAQPAAANYAGGNVQLLQPRSGRQRRFDRRDSAVDGYATALQRRHDAVLDEVGASGAKIYSFSYALNGFAANLTAAQAGQLARHADVRNIWPDSDQQVQTNNSSIFLGLLDQQGGLRADLGLTGENVVVGVIDSGIAVDHPALSDVEEHVPRACLSHWASSSWLGKWLCHSVKLNPPTTSIYEPIERFAGTCQTGDGFSAEDCNNKIVGARFYIDGFLQRHALDENEFVSPRDADGHGTHIATTIAGNPVTATIFGTRLAQISGLAPRARIAVYKACWVRPNETRATCTTADLARAIDDAVADGVDIINYSVGSLETDLSAPDDLALLNALDAGVLSVVAAGNDGPELGTIGSPSSAPWVLTVAASTQSGTTFSEAVEITAPADLAGAIPMLEANFTPALSGLAAIEADIGAADDDQNVLGNGSIGSIRDACEPLVDSVSGQIALIERGGCEFVVKVRNAEEAGAVAAIVYNNSSEPLFAMNGDGADVGIPAIMISRADGLGILDELAAGRPVTARLAKGIFIERSQTGNVMAEFSSRGPSLSEGDFVKPDVTAPGVDILAGHTPDAANGLRGQRFQYLTGTSMSTPQVAAVAALLREAHPEWTPGELKSALMTTARQSVVEEDRESPAHPFDMGAGHIVPNRAFDPGLVYATDYLDHAAFLCGLDKTPFLGADCDILEQAGYSFAPREVNLPSIGVTELISGDGVTRRVTNLGEAATYQASISAPFGIEVIVEPSSLSLGVGETGEFALYFETTAPDLDLWTFGELVWSDGSHTVQSPLALRPVTLRAPTQLDLIGTEGDGTFEVAYGYSGAYDSAVLGLNPPFLLEEDAFVDEDLTNTFSFRQGGGVNQHWFTVAPEDIYLRVSLFDEFTDGNDDLDLYLYRCTNGTNCIQVAESGSFTSAEQIDIAYPIPGQYTVLVHGFETDAEAGGPGARYSLFAWALNETDPGGNLEITIPTSVEAGDRFDLPIAWGPLDPAVRYLGGILHFTSDAFDPYSITLVTARDL